MSKVTFEPGVRARGKSIQLDFYYGGLRNKETIKLDPTQAKNIKFANNKMGGIKYEIEIGTFNYAEHFPNSKRLHKFGSIATNSMTIAELIDMYYQLVESTWRTQTKRTNKGYIKNHIEPGIGNILLRRIKPSQIRHWISLASEPPKQINNWLSILRGAFKMAQADELITSNPMTGIENLKVPKKEPNPFTIEEIQLIITNTENESARHAFDYAFWTGISTSEQIGLQWGDVEFEENCVYIRRAIVANKLEETKNSTRWRRIDLLPPARKALEKLKKLNQSEIWVFINPNTNGIWTYSTLNKHWKKSITLSKIPYRIAYTTRHTYASIMLSIGVPLPWIKKQMGHTNYRMLEEVYARWMNISSAQRKEVLGWFSELSQNGHIPEEIAPFIKTIQ